MANKIKEKLFSVTSTGDSLFVAPFPKEYQKASAELKEILSSCDLRLTNLETNLSDFEYPANAYSGGTWLNTRKEYINDLVDLGFDFFGNANNHAFDYGEKGLLSTIDTLDAKGLKHAGTGRSLAQAEAPAIIEKGGVKTAIFAVDTSFEVASKAGNPSKKFKPRPGVNYLGYETCYKVTEEQIENLRKIAEDTHLNYQRNFNIQTGFIAPDKEGYFNFGGLNFTTKDGIPKTKCNAKDLQRILGLIKDVKDKVDYVFMLVHCHKNDDISHANPPEFLIEFSKACIDHGVHAVFGGGCHQLRGMEMYKGFPIFYSLGDFIYQGLKVEYLPPDFMEKFNLDVDTTASEALYARSRGGKVGLHLLKENYLTVLPKITFEKGKVKDIEIYPVSLNFEDKSDLNGLPIIAKEEAKEIYEVYSRLSEQFGVKLKYIDGIIKIAE